MLPLTGYADRFSVAPGETIAFKVSSTAATPYQVRLVRLISGDPNPAGPGIKEEPVAAPFAASYPSRVQPVPLGSYLRVPDAPALRRARQLHAGRDHLADHARPGPPGHRRAPRSEGWHRIRPVRGRAEAPAPWSGTAAARIAAVHVGKPLLARTWYRVWATYDAATRTLAVGQAPLVPRVRADDAGRASTPVAFPPALDSGTPLLVAALGGDPVAGHYNGKVERPALYDVALAETAIPAAPDGISSPPPGGGLGLQPGNLRHARGGRGAERAPRRARQPPGARHDGLDLDGRGDVLAPRARAVRRHPFPR